MDSISYQRHMATVGLLSSGVNGVFNVPPSNLGQHRQEIHTLRTFLSLVIGIYHDAILHSTSSHPSSPSLFSM